MVWQDDTVIASTTTNSDGCFSTEATIPSEVSAGTYDVFARDAAGNEAEAPFTVEGSVNDPDPGF